MGKTQRMMSRTMRLRLALGFGAAVLVLLAFAFGVSLVAAVFAPTSETAARVRSGALGRALPQGILPALAVGALVAVLCEPLTRRNRR